MFCARCGAANPAGPAFCTACGSPLEAPVMAGPVAPPSLASEALPHTPVRLTTGKAMASLICGIFFPLFPLAVAAIVLGHLALSEIKKSGEKRKGDWMAIAGLVLGYSGALLVPLVLVAALVIPNLFRARMATDETSAFGSMRVLETAAITYSSQYSNGFPPSMSAMDGLGGGEPTCEQSQLIDSTLAAGQKNGYLFSYLPTGAQILTDEATSRGCTTPGATTFEIHADPVTRGTTGERSFYADQTGVVRSEPKAPATADSPPVE
jgi:type IV pilus assembly protein PilA